METQFLTFFYAYQINKRKCLWVGDHPGFLGGGNLKNGLRPFVPRHSLFNRSRSFFYRDLLLGA